jgi:hypothetical protein
MKKIAVLLFALLLIIEAKEYSVNIYTIEIDVNATKIDGKAWDIAGGSPDILVYIDGKKMSFNPNCQNRCSMEFIVKNKSNSWYFEIYDRDFANNDLIGKGECTLSNKCQIGRAKIFIKE